MTTRISFLLAAIFALLVLSAAACGGDGDEEAAVEEPAEAQPAEPFEVRSVKLELGEREAECQYGEATLTALDRNTTQVILELFDGPEQPQAAHLHDGTCRDPGEVVHELNTLDNGRSQTRVDAALEELVKAGLVLGIHRSTEESSEHVLCEWVTDESREATKE